MGATLWGIADLHLALGRPFDPARHAARWDDHTERIAANWRGCVAPGDVVVLPGDISMARNHREVQPDLAWLQRLPGTKVLCAGNHDAWFNRVAAIRPMLRSSLRAVEGDAVALPGLIVCGTRGTAPIEPADPDSAADRESRRELDRLRSALADAARLRQHGEPIVALWHYPPFDEAGRPGACVALLEAARVSHCVYGHVHAQRQWSRMVQGELRGVRYHCVAADAIGFHPLRLASIPEA